MLNIGLTGGIGSGKSTVAKWFAEQGVPVLDADKTAHELLESDIATIENLVQEFGSDILKESGGINRGKLGALVFNSENARKKLENIIHPRIRSAMKEQNEALREAGKRHCIWDVPLLFETGFDRNVDEIWVVWTTMESQITRVMARDKLSRAEVVARLAAQMSLDEKRLRADVVVDNSGDEKELIRQLEVLWAKSQKVK